jgi:hypothetical protein
LTKFGSADELNAAKANIPLAYPMLLIYTMLRTALLTLLFSFTALTAFAKEDAPHSFPAGPVRFEDEVIGLRTFLPGIDSPDSLSRCSAGHQTNSQPSPVRDYLRVDSSPQLAQPQSFKKEWF